MGFYFFKMLFFDLLYLLLSFALTDVLQNIFPIICSVGSLHPLTHFLSKLSTKATSVDHPESQDKCLYAIL